LAEVRYLQMHRKNTDLFQFGIHPETEVALRQLPSFGLKPLASSRSWEKRLIEGRLTVSSLPKRG
jgi:hypothetical protein